MRGSARATGGMRGSACAALVVARATGVLRRAARAALVVALASGVGCERDRTARPPAAEPRRNPERETGCERLVERHLALLPPIIGDAYRELLVRRRTAIVSSCLAHATAEYLACVQQAPDHDALYACSSATSLRPAPPAERERAPTRDACEQQADVRIELHAAVELPSIARGIAAGRTNMIDTCASYWSAPYVHCLIGAPTLTYAQSCETVGRVR